VPELILGGRLAARPGGWRLSRWLFRTALQRDPSSPRARYFVRSIHRRRWCLLDDLRSFQANPELFPDDPEIQAAWLSSYAVISATLRDFQQAHQCLQQAHSLGTRDSWVLSCESRVLGLEGRWEEALQSAEQAWEINPGRSRPTRKCALSCSRDCAPRRVRSRPWPRTPSNGENPRSSPGNRVGVAGIRILEFGKSKLCWIW